MSGARAAHQKPARNEFEQICPGIIVRKSSINNLSCLLLADQRQPLIRVANQRIIYAPMRFDLGTNWLCPCTHICTSTHTDIRWESHRSTPGSVKLICARPSVVGTRLHEVLGAPAPSGERTMVMMNAKPPPAKLAMPPMHYTGGLSEKATVGLKSRGLRSEFTATLRLKPNIFWEGDTPNSDHGFQLNWKMTISDIANACRLTCCKKQF